MLRFSAKVQNFLILVFKFVFRQRFFFYFTVFASCSFVYDYVDECSSHSQKHVTIREKLLEVEGLALTLGN